MIDTVDNRPEKAILIGLSSPRADERILEYEWNEFAELVKTAGAEEAGRMLQARETPDPALFLGSGKAEALAELVRSAEADLVISIQELSPVQVRNLEDQVRVRVIDRTDLILDIFAQRARSREGQLQVELAQLNYSLPRLGGTGLALSRQGGGIGTRGPGETKLEANRRAVRRRIADLRSELAEVQQNRTVQRHLREKKGIPTIAMVGYTNAGKSTLFNRLTDAGTSARDRLFDTLDPLSRQLALDRHRTAILLDTVGFISNLPHQLVAAFKATLEETLRANLILHVMDAGAPDLERRHAAVRAVLAELGAESKETLAVLNKIDLLDSEPLIQRLSHQWSAVPVSAASGAGIPELLTALRRRLSAGMGEYRLLVPFSEAGMLDRLHRQFRILEEEYTAEGVRLAVESEAEPIRAYQRFLTGEERTEC
ncbi:GTP-binding protein HflX [Hydrogenispora ethanolica]|uniref:GTPase HflX n=1 Tax=Hydrogenispora ethanolica TaxID=1082276 RepID=A0A4R1S6U6_HYDET|nr:GTPase HflX [Hydrogenispora ethanolica]TCL75093.1 GTP-binding protein HflX [Hydrogenispora ethanolica]